MFRDRVLQHYREKGYTLRERVQVRGTSGTIHACDLVAQGPLGNLVVEFEDYGGFEGPELDSVRRAARDVGATPVVAAEQVGQTVRMHAARLGVVVLDAATLDAPASPRMEMTTSGEVAHPSWPGQQTPDEDGPAPWPDHRAPRAWPEDGRVRPATPASMDPADVDDLVDEWSHAETPTKTRREDPGFWRYGDEPSAATPKPVVETTANQGFSWLEPGSEEAQSVQVLATGRPATASTAISEVDSQPQAPHAAEPVSRATEQAPRITGPQAAQRLRWLVGYAVAGASAGIAFLGLGVLFGVL